MNTFALRIEFRKTLDNSMKASDLLADSNTAYIAWIEKELTTTRRQRDRMAEVIKAASVLIAAKGRHNAMLAYNGLRNALQSLTPNEP